LLIGWVKDILKECKIKEMYAYSYGWWLRGDYNDSEYLHAKEVLKKHSIKSVFPEDSFTGAVFFDSSEGMEIEHFFETLSRNALRGRSDISFLFIGEELNFLILPSDHFDYHAYPSDVKLFKKIAEGLVASPKLKVTEEKVEKS